MENLQKFFKDKRVLITGHTGFKGSWLTQILLNWGADVIGIALKPSVNPSLFNLLNVKENIKNYFCDIRNFKKVKEIILKEKPEIVFHLAAQSLVRESYDYPLYTFETNIMGTANILQAIKETDTVRAAVIITTDKVYENKESGRLFKENDKLGGYDPYSASKAAAEITIASYINSFFNPVDYDKKHRTLIASARAGNVIGGGDWQRDRLMPDIIRAVFEKKEKVAIRNPNAIRPWQFVLGPLYGYLMLAQKLYKGEKEFSVAWNFGPKERNYLTVKEFVETVLKTLKRGSYVIKRDLNKHEADFLRLDISKAKKVLKWRPTFDLKQTLKLTLDWYKSFYDGGDILDITNQQIKLFFGKSIRQ